MPGAVKGFRVLKAKLKGKIYFPIPIWVDLGDNIAIDRMLIDLDKSSIGEINYWEHWVPIKSDTHPVRDVN
jgi:hypothetical protein